MLIRCCRLGRMKLSNCFEPTTMSAVEWARAFVGPRSRVTDARIWCVFAHSRPDWRLLWCIYLLGIFPKRSLPTVPMHKSLDKATNSKGRRSSDIVREPIDLRYHLCQFTPGRACSRCLIWLVLLVWTELGQSVIRQVICGASAVNLPRRLGSLWGHWVARDFVCRG